MSNRQQPGDEPEDLDAATLGRVRALVHGTAGIVISDSKAGMIRARLARRLATTGFEDISTYLDHVQGSERGGELSELISAMTTNVTHFFREGYHFDALAREVVPVWTREGGLRSLWSAGCASGEEAYSIAMTLRDAGLGRDRVRVLATDIDRAVLARAAIGIYPQKSVASIAPEVLDRHFHAVEGGWRPCPALRRLVTFRALNLVERWPFPGGFDAIFCRNVAIYFDVETQHRLWRRMVSALKPGGRLFIGHSERLPEELLGRELSYLGRTMYAKSAAAADREHSR